MSFKISDICEINGYNLSTKHNLDFINYLDTANLNEGSIEEIQYLGVNKDKVPSRAKRIIRENDILISTVRPNQKHYGIIKDLAENLVASTGFAVLTADSQKVHPEYLYNFLIQDHITTYLNNVAETSTSTYPSIKPSVIAELEIELPLLDEQKEIANILSTLDGKIEVNKRINKTLENMAQEIYKRWFVDFEFPNEDGEPYKSSGGEMVESQLGSIPEGWDIVNFEDVFYFQEGPGIRNWQYVNNGTKFINIRCIQDNDLLLDTANMISDEEAEGKYKHFMLDSNDIVMSTSGTLGRYAIVREEHLPLCLNTSVIRFKTNRESDDYSFMYGYLTSEEFMYHLNTKASGSVQKNFGPMHLKQIKLVYPYKSTIQNFDSALKPIIGMSLQTKRENDRIKKIRDILVPKLMSGEIRVPMEES